MTIRATVTLEQISEATGKVSRTYSEIVEGVTLADPDAQLAEIRDAIEQASRGVVQAMTGRILKQS
jgi:hypothetical protein